jgi:REP element-mobilizing transposase RayT
VGAWYHITARGNERRAIFCDDRDRVHFYDLLDGMNGRFGVRIHAFVLMENHYHLLVELTQPNLSRAVQWLNTSYTVWFNRRHSRSGHLLQGRFKAIVVDQMAWGVALSRYVHLNPVRVTPLGMGKKDRQRARTSGLEAPDAAMVQKRLRILRNYRWSSYPAYVSGKAPRWLCIEDVQNLAGGKMGERKTNYRRYVEDAVRNGLPRSPWEETTEQVILGSEEFIRSLRKAMLPKERSMPSGARLAREPMTFERIIREVENACGKKWIDFKTEHGDVNRDLALFLARRYTGLTLAELARAAGLSSASAVSIAVQRFARKAAGGQQRKRVQTVCQMLNVQL